MYSLWDKISPTFLKMFDPVSIVIQTPNIIYTAKGKISLSTACLHVISPGDMYSTSGQNCSLTSAFSLPMYDGSHTLLFYRMHGWCSLQLPCAAAWATGTAYYNWCKSHQILVVSRATAKSSSIVTGDLPQLVAANWLIEQILYYV